MGQDCMFGRSAGSPIGKNESRFYHFLTLTEDKSHNMPEFKIPPL